MPAGMLVQSSVVAADLLGINHPAAPQSSCVGTVEIYVASGIHLGTDPHKNASLNSIKNRGGLSPDGVVCTGRNAYYVST